MTEKNSKERARLHTTNRRCIAAVEGAARETNNMTIKRYECITEWGGTHYDATPTEDGPWVSHVAHAKEIADLRALAREAVKEAYAEAFADAVGVFTTFSGVLDEDLIQKCWLMSDAACDFKDGDE